MFVNAIHFINDNAAQSITPKNVQEKNIFARSSVLIFLLPPKSLLKLKNNYMMDCIFNITNLNH